jgi:hypothetical protein
MNDFLGGKLNVFHMNAPQYITRLIEIKKPDPRR